MRKCLFIFTVLISCMVFYKDITFAHEKEIKIGLSKYSNTFNVPIKNKSILLGYDKKHINATDSFSVRLFNNSVALYDGETVVEIFGSLETPEITALNGEYINISDSAYRGKIQFLLNANGGITVINLIDIDEYLYSVVPSEMPSSWNLEALKAQAVAARTYTYTKIGVHDKDGYNLCDTDHCQSYLGVLNEQLSSTQAVDETRGIMIYYDNKLIEAFYFSSSGGATENSENVWYETVPYLRGVVEVFEDNYKEWSRTFTFDEIRSILSKNGVEIGNVTNIAITKVSEMGRVNELTITGTNGSKMLTKEEIRSFFRVSEEGSLDSRNFTIVESVYKNEDAVKLAVTNGNFIEEKYLNELFVTSSDGIVKILNTAVVKGEYDTAIYSLENKVLNQEVSSTGNTVTFTGKGWGHGVGLSQYGANGMANAGYTYKEILEFYYTGVRVE